MNLLKSQLVALASASILLSLVTGAQSQSQTTGLNVEARLTVAVKKIQTACTNDVKSFCNSVTPGEGRLVLCMMAHEDKVSTQCEFALYEASRNLEHALDRIEQAAEACWTDIEKSCAKVDPGGKRIVQCLMENRSSLQQPCQAVLSKISAK